MVSPSSSALIVCLDTSDAIVALLTDVFVVEGFRAEKYVLPLEATVLVVLALLNQVRPQVCVYGIVPPYAENWAAFTAIHAVYPACAYVLTATHARALDEVAGPNTTMEVVGKPFDLDHLIAAVSRALATLPERHDPQEASGA